MDLKTAYVRKMFDRIAPQYDRMNRVMTGGFDLLWRRRLLEHISRGEPCRALDIACGTGDLIALMAQRISSLEQIVGVDLSPRMLLEAEKRFAKRISLIPSIELREENCEQLSLPTDTYDVVTCAFGIRNVSHPMMALREMHRVCRPGGRLAILELSEPKHPLLLRGYNLYATKIIPWLGRLVAQDPHAYSYLPQSIKLMPQRKALAELIHEAGFRGVHYQEMPLEVCVLYTAEA